MNFIELVSYLKSPTFVQLYQSYCVSHFCHLSQLQCLHNSHLLSHIHYSQSCVHCQHSQLHPQTSPTILFIRYRRLISFWPSLLERSVAMFLIHRHGSCTCCHHVGRIWSFRCSSERLIIKMCNYESTAGTMLKSAFIWITDLTSSVKKSFIYIQYKHSQQYFWSPVQDSDQYPNSSFSHSSRSLTADY
jgi:hypothetical protein